MAEWNEQSDESPVVHESTWNEEAETDPAYAVVSTVANATDRNATELPPLYEAIDPDALNRLVSPDADGSADRITFRYCGFEVCVRGAGVRLRKPVAQS